MLWLAEGLRDLGHTVTIAAAPGSKLPAGVNLWEVAPTDAPEAWMSKLAGNFDVVHFHAPLSPEIWERVPLPKLVTIHGNGQPGEIFAKNAVFLSKNHAERHGARVFVYNGINLDEYPLSREHHDWVLFLAKTSWRLKNLRGAYQYCRESRTRFKIAGGKRPWDLRFRSFFDERMQWMGPVNGSLKMELLGHARALIFPILWEEPFGLAMVEALACGTPVFASPRGSVPEIVTPEVGLLLNGPHQWIAALKDHSRHWSPEACRARVAAHFSHNQMAQNYLSLYTQVIRGEDLNPAQPRGVA